MVPLNNVICPLTNSPRYFARTFRFQTRRGITTAYVYTCTRYPYVFGEIFCQLRGMFAEMSANATVLTITAFTAERYVAICHPFMAQSMSKLSRAVKLIVIIWLVAILFAIPQVSKLTNYYHFEKYFNLIYYYNY